MSSDAIAFIGAGNMACAIAQGLISNKGIEPSTITCTDISTDRLSWVKEKLGVGVSQDNAEAVTPAKIVVVAVKPQVLSEVLSACASAFKAGQILISVCAGVPIKRYTAEVTAGVKVARAMPNTPALVGAGATALAFGEGFTESEQSLVQSFFQSVGECVVLDERYMDAVTGLSGSGPAYVLTMIEALSDGGVRAGLPRQVASALARQTVLGTAKLVAETGTHPAELREQVTSPGGTTAEGLFALEKAGVRFAFADAVCQAARRAKELG